MINFASLFNQFRSSNSSGLSDLFDQPSIKMGRVLDEDTFLNEYKSANPRAIEFMKYGRYLELVQFVTIVGSGEDKKRGYKYPLSACDVLCIDNSTAIQFFLPEKPLFTDVKVTEEVEVDVEVQVQQEVSVPQVEKQEKKAEEQVVQPAQPLVKAQEPVQVEKADVEQKTKQNVPVVEQVPQASQKKEAVSQPTETVVEPVLANPVQAAPTSSQSQQVVSQPVVAGQQEKTQEQKNEPEAAEPTKVVKKIIKKQIRTVQKTIKKDLEPLIYKLLAYFDGQLNYTLAGYVCKILSYFFTKKPAQLLKYIFQAGVADKILNHAQSRSVGDFIVKILIVESTLCIEKRSELFKELLTRLSQPYDVHVISNLSAYACEVIEKIAANLKSNNKILEFNNTFFSLQIITEVIKNVMSDQENISIYNAPILFTYLTNVPFVLPEDDAIVSDFKLLLESFVDKSLVKLQVDNKSRPKLGFGRIKIVQILRYILKENILNVKDIVGRKTQFFPTLYHLMKQYDMNNLLHNEIIKIIDIALLQNESSALSKVILDGDVLLDFITSEANDDVKIRAGNSVYKTRKGYIAHIINLCIRLRQLGQKNTQIKKLTEKPQFTGLFQTFIEREIYNTKKTLAGYAMRKDLKHEIMFQKDEILSAYLTFFQKCPSAVFEVEPEPVNIEHPDLVEELQKQLEDNLAIKPKEVQEQVNTDDIMPPELEVTVDVQSQTRPGFWTMHLQYNIDDLLLEM